MKAIPTRHGSSARAVAIVAAVLWLLQALVPTLAHVSFAGAGTAAALSSADRDQCRVHAARPGDPQPSRRSGGDCGAGCALCTTAGRSDAGLAAPPVAVSELLAPQAAARADFPRPQDQRRCAGNDGPPPASRGPPAFS